MTHSFSRLKRFFSSVFTKLLIISLVTWLLIIIATISYFIITRHGTSRPFVRNLNAYTNYIIKDLGTLPNHNKAKTIAKETGMHITFIGKDQHWSTRTVFPEVKHLRFRSIGDDPSIQFSRRAGRHIIRYQTSEGIIFFEFTDGDEKDEQNNPAQLILFALLSLILLCSYLAIRRVLAPLKWFNTAVHKVKEGDFSHRVPLRGNDELTDIAGGLNEMISQLKVMLDNRENLLRDVSHELRTPLTRIRVALEFLEKSNTRNDILQDIQEMEDMIRSILETARKRHRVSQQEFKKLNVEETVQTVTERYRGSEPAVIFSSPRDRFSALADEKLLQSVISNCIDNGIKFSSATSGPIVVSIKKSYTDAIITIADNGPGIAEEELPFIFEPFYRIDQSRSRENKGYGLGLSICKAIIEAHGGSIVAHSEKGEGTTISITLPCTS